MNTEQKHIDIFLAPIKKCMEYKPKFGTNNSDGVSYSDFSTLYGTDPFYSWIGLDSELMYSAHKAAGGMTSIYRQIGVGCEYLFREIIHDCAKYESKDSANWSYDTKTSSGKVKTLKLDGRIQFSDIKDSDMKQRAINWLDTYCKAIFNVPAPKNGIVFEVRQGYKSKDSKRQNADIDNATVAWSYGYLPIFAIFSSQIDSDIVLRYKNNRCGILVGTVGEDDNHSLFTFTKNVIGYDLADFFKRNSELIKKEINIVLQELLSAE